MKKLLNKQGKTLSLHQFDDEEKSILRDIEAGDMTNVKNMEAEISRLSELFKASRKKSKNINLRLAEADLIRIKLLANKNGLPYQTLISTVLRQYVSGRIQVTL